MNNTGKIPVTILTGFLGAGKTTLLNNIIKKYSGKRFAVVENEFGEVGIDGGLIVGNVSNVFELSNGCLCCNLSKDLEETLNNLLTSKYDFDNLLVETTGIADPAGVIDTFVGFEEFQQKFIVDSVICLADAMTYEESAGEEPEVHRQLAVADIIILNKIGDVSPEYGEHVKQLIRSVNPTARMYCVSHADISGCDILDTFAYTSSSIEKQVLDFRNATPLKFDMMDIDSAPSFARNPEGKHGTAFRHNIVSEAFTIKGGLDEQRFVSWMQGMLNYNSATVFRIKGILSIAGKSSKYVLQSVRNFFLVEEQGNWPAGQERFSKLVFIGKKLNRAAIQECLDSFVVSD